MNESIDALMAALVSHPDWYGGRPMLPDTGIPVWIAAACVQAGDDLDACCQAYPACPQAVWIRFWPLLQQYPANPRSD